MRLSRLKTDRQLDTFNNRGLKIQTYGEKNDQPQRIAEVIEASTTASSCVNIYAKFIAGRGFADAAFYKRVVNRCGADVDALLRAVADDFAHFGGFAIHVNYNGLGEITTASHVPFEWLRFEELDENFRFDRLAMHPDWGRRFTKLRPFRPKDIEFFHFFDPRPDTIEREVQEAGGWNGYRGQILYYSNRGEKTYPLPIFAAALTDMNTEEGLSNVRLRNARNNFLPAGMIIDYDNTANSDRQESETKAELQAFQGDTVAGTLLYVNVKNGETPPEFKPFKSSNYDKDFEQAEKNAPDIIGRAFMQPPILRAEDVGANFGADLMTNAYDFYNSITEDERMAVSQQFRRIFEHWYDPTINAAGNYEILPKEYRVNATLAERLGDNIDKVLEIIFDKTKSEPAKRAVLSIVYGLEEESINKLLGALPHVD